MSYPVDVPVPVSQILNVVFDPVTGTLKTSGGSSASSVAINDGTVSGTKAKVAVASTIVVGDNALAVSDPVVANNTKTPSTISNGVKAVTTAGTRVALAASTACSYVIVVANPTNTGNIFIGGSGVTSANGVPLSAGLSIVIPIDNLSKVFIDAEVSGEGVGFCYGA